VDVFYDMEFNYVNIILKRITLLNNGGHEDLTLFLLWDDLRKTKKFCKCFVKWFNYYWDGSYV